MFMHNTDAVKLTLCQRRCKAHESIKLDMIGRMWQGAESSSQHILGPAVLQAHVHALALSRCENRR